jgi:adenylate cyclase
MLRDDEVLRSVLREREMQAEGRINVLRGVVLGGAAVADVVYGAVGHLFSWQLAALAVGVVPFCAVYLLVVHRLSRGAAYRPWLKYVTVTIDYALVLFVFVEYRAIGFFGLRERDAGVPEMVSFLILLNMLSAFRHSAPIIVYSTILATGTSVMLGLRYDASLALKIYAPLASVASGWLTLLISVGVNRLFLRLRRREQLLRFLPHDVVRGIDTGQIRLELGGIKREATILLSDLRAFTHMSEHRDPAEVVALLNEYFTAMAAVVRAHGGTIDKFIGDGMLAVFGVPVARDDHAVRAVEAARDMQRALVALNDRHRPAGRPTLSMGIAVHTGTVVAGNVGAPDRMEYTVIGDVVNLTARIEELNKRFGTSILLSASTWERVRDRFACRLVGESEIRGREGSVRLYEPQP